MRSDPNLQRLQVRRARTEGPGRDWPLLSAMLNATEAAVKIRSSRCGAQKRWRALSRIWRRSP